MRLSLAFILALSPLAFGQEDERAARLAELRAEVADLAEEIEMEREDQRGRLRALDAQKADAQVQLRRAELRLTEVQKAMEERREALAGEENSGDALTPVVRDALDQLRSLVRSGLPYRVDERLAALDRLEAQVDEGVLRPQKAAHRVWQFFEDELRLTRENALDRQVIELAGSDTLVQVARVGMLAVYFKAEDGRIGQAVRTDGGWQWVVLDDPADAEHVDAFIDALGKQIRTGWFHLPGLIPSEAT